MPDRCRALFIALAVAAVGVGALLPAVSASAATRSPTKVAVSLKFPAFHGGLQSPRSACVSNRGVRLYREKSGPDKLLGTDRTDASGKWSIPIGKRLISGSYYAKAPARGNCKAGKSKVLPVD